MIDLVGRGLRAVAGVKRIQHERFCSLGIKSKSHKSSSDGGI
jgi:hypothetical protein